jgi:uncharacterized protein YjbJ (UPF0337 family)
MKATRVCVTIVFGVRSIPLTQREQQMSNQQTVEGSWSELKGKVKSRWGKLTDDDLKGFRGDTEQLIGTIQRKTGEARESIEQFFADLSSHGGSTMGRAGEAVRSYAQHAVEAVQDTSHQAAESIRERYDDVEDMVRQRPAESLAVCFGIGIITGVVLGLLVRR